MLENVINIAPKYDLPDMFDPLSLDYYDLVGDFVRKKEFRNKRFDRYVNKTKDYLNKYLHEEYGNTFECCVKNNSSTNITYCVEDFILFLLVLQYPDTYDDDIQFQSLHKYFAEPTVNFDTHMLEKYGLDDVSAWLPIIEYELKEACAQHIIEKCYENERIVEDNYYLSLPSSPVDAERIIQNVINWTHIDIERMLVAKADKNISRSNKRVETLNTKLKETNRALKESEKAREKTEKELTQRIASLMRQTSPTDERQSETDEVNENVLILRRQNDKLKQKYDSLLSKYNELKAQTGITEENEDKVEEKINNLDVNGNYLFVIYYDSSIIGSIKEHFPNASFIDKISNITPGSYDMVVAITSYIDHSTYLGIKKQCKNKKIPFVHCACCNAELICDAMWNAIN